MTLQKPPARNSAVGTRLVDYRDHDQIEHLIADGWTYIGEGWWTPPAVADATLTRVGSKRFLPRLIGDSLRGDGLVLTHPVAEDAVDLCANELDAELRRHAIFPPTPSATMKSLIRDAYPGWRIGDSTFLIGRHTSDGPPLTKISIRRLIPPGVLDVGYATVVAHRGHGYAAQSLRLFTRWAFDVAGIQRIELGIKPENRASASTALKAGYRLECVRRCRLQNADGSFDDEHSYIAVNTDKNRTWKHTA